MTRSGVQYMLANRIYVGEFAHYGTIYPGRHEAIIDKPTFEAAQKLLAVGGRQKREYVSHGKRVVLKGIVFDADGQPMRPLTSAMQRSTKYAYYCSPTRLGAEDDQFDDAIRRVAARAAEELVGKWTKRLLEMDEVLLGDVRRVLARMEVHATVVHLVIR